MPGMLEGKTVLITGAARGIGRGTAVVLAREGARLALADLSVDGARETADLIVRDGGQAIAIAADISKSADVTAMLAATLDAYGRLDCAFNNAGINGGQAGMRGLKTADWTEEAFDRLLAVNLKGTWLCMKAEINHMLANGGGAIVNTASLAGLTGYPTTSGYAASKHGVVGLTKTAALDHAPSIRINCVCPGWIETEMTAATITNFGPRVLGTIPLGQVGQPEDIGEMVCWLLSTRARFVTGGAFAVDGGEMAG